MDRKVKKPMSKYDFAAYPSAWGMGSDICISFVSEENIRRTIRREIEKKLDAKNYDEQLTGERDGKPIRVSRHGLERAVDEVMCRELATCSTYAGQNDLVELPEDMKILTEQEHMREKNLKIRNRFLCHLSRVCL